MSWSDCSSCHESALPLWQIMRTRDVGQIGRRQMSVPIPARTHTATVWTNDLTPSTQADRDVGVSSLPVVMLAVPADVSGSTETFES